MRRLAALRESLRVYAVSLPPATGCALCNVGFPKNRDEHYGTQSLGMIPNTACTALPPPPRRNTYTPEQLAWLRREYPRLSRRALTAAYNAKFGTEISHDSLVRLLKTQGIRSGRSGCFPKGHAPGNKGVKGWRAGGRSVATRFKPGHIGGIAAERLVPLGTDRKTADGYWRIKVAAAPYGTPGCWRNWKYKHVLTYEQAHGPVPRGSLITFRDGNRDNCALDNLECITRAEHAVRSKSGYYKLPPELRPTGALIARLKLTAAERRRELT